MTSWEEAAPDIKQTLVVVIIPKLSMCVQQHGCKNIDDNIVYALSQLSLFKITILVFCTLPSTLIAKKTFSSS